MNLHTDFFASTLFGLALFLPLNRLAWEWYLSEFRIDRAKVVGFTRFHWWAAVGGPFLCMVAAGSTPGTRSSCSTGIIKGPFRRTRSVYPMVVGSIIAASVIPGMTRGIIPNWRMFWFAAGPVLAALTLYTLFRFLPVIWHLWRLRRPGYPTVEAV